MFKKILVAFDGSIPSKRALKTAIALAKDQNALLQVLHVLDERGPILYPEGGLFLDQVITALRDAGKKLLAEVQKDALKQGIKVQTRMVETMGMPVADIIAREAARMRVDLIVMGTHGRRGIGRMVMGSDAEGVVRLTTVPVMLIRMAEPKARAARAGASARSAR